MTTLQECLDNPSLRESYHDEAMFDSSWTKFAHIDVFAQMEFERFGWEESDLTLMHADYEQGIFMFKTRTPGLVALVDNKTGKIYWNDEDDFFDLLATGIERKRECRHSDKG